MKTFNLFITIFISLIILGCTNNDPFEDATGQDTIISKWKLTGTSVNNNPFNNFDSERTLTFTSSSKAVCSVEFCTTFSDVGEETIGTYNGAQGSLFFNNCQAGYSRDQDTLIVNYIYTTSIRHKYIRITD